MDWLSDRIAAIRAGGPYRPPTERERAETTAGLVSVLDHAADAELLARNGFSLRHGVDEATDRGYTLVADAAGTERAWGVVVLDDGAPRQVVEVPHPKSDRWTGRLGLELFRAVPGSVLLVAGAHRNAGGGAADVAHRADSVFHAFAEVLAERAGVEVQLHGYAARSLPGVDAVVSSGAGRVLAWHRALLDALAARGFTARGAWGGACRELAGRTNVQGVAAAGRGTPFLHLELAPPPRADPARRAAVVDALKRVVGVAPGAVRRSPAPD